MVARRVVALLALLAALPLVGAPISMADWGEQAVFSAEPVDQSQIDDEIPVLHYENLSTTAQTAVRRTIESPDNSHTVYGQEDFPDRFFYSDYSAPGSGLYAVVYEGQYYRLYTYAGGGFPFVYWFLELPFVMYGIGLAAAAVGVYRETGSLSVAVPATGFGAGIHVLGPEFDFPLLEPMQFVGVGALGTLAFAAALVWDRTRTGDAPGDGDATAGATDQ